MEPSDHPEKNPKKQRISEGYVCLGIIVGFVLLVWVSTLLHVFFVSILDLPERFYIYLLDITPFLIVLIIFIVLRL